MTRCTFTWYSPILPGTVRCMNQTENHPPGHIWFPSRRARRKRRNGDYVGPTSWVLLGHEGPPDPRDPSIYKGGHG